MCVLKIIETALNWEETHDSAVTIRREGNRFRVFTIPSQHVEAESLEEALYIVDQFICGDRCWKCENWSEARCPKHRPSKWLS